MRFNLTTDLTPLRIEASRKVDNAAELERAKYITLGSGQAMVYGEKEKEAELVAADISISPMLVPHIAAEANAFGVTMLEQAGVILTMANQWRFVSSAIETKRLVAKTGIALAATPAEIDAATEIDWSLS